MAGQSDGETSFSITGGAGRVHYTLTEIEAAAGRINLVAQDMGEVAATLDSELEWISSFTARLQASGLQGAEATHFAAGVAAGGLASAQGSVAAAARGVQELAAHASAAARRYEEAEAETVARERARRSRALFDGVQASTAGIFLPLVLWWQYHVLRDGADRQGMRDTAEDMLNDGPAYIAGLLGPAVGLGYLLGRSPIEGRGRSGALPAAGVRKFVDWSGLARPGHLELRAVPAGEWHGRAGDWRPGHAVPDSSGGVQLVVDPSVSGLLAGSQEAYGYPPGSIAVDRLDRPDGTRAWIVHLPGTEDWSKVDSANPFDFEGDLEGMTAGQQTLFKQQQIVVQELMRQALADAGALPTDDVLITGHSGGGIHAAAAAANPAFLADFNVKMIIIAGAPARNLPVAPNVLVLDLQNDDDLVAAADYGPPPNSVNRVTVTSHRPGAAEGKGTGDVIKDAHDLGNYIDDATALEQSNDPGIKAVRDSVGLFLGTAAAGGGPATVSRKVYQGRDADGPKTEAKSKPVMPTVPRPMKPGRLFPEPDIPPLPLPGAGAAVTGGPGTVSGRP